MCSFRINTHFCRMLDGKGFSGFSHFQFLKTDEEWGTELWIWFTKILAWFFSIWCPSMCHVFCEQQLCVGVYTMLSELFSFFFKTQGSVMFCYVPCSIAKHTTKRCWICQTDGEVGLGGGVPKFKEHEINILLGTELWKLSYLPVGSSVMRVNSLSIHHGCLCPAVSQAVPKTSSSQEGWPREIDERGQEQRDRCGRGGM